MRWMYYLALVLWCVSICAVTSIAIVSLKGRIVALVHTWLLVYILAPLVASVDAVRSEAVIMLGLCCF